MNETMNQFTQQEIASDIAAIAFLAQVMGEQKSLTTDEMRALLDANDLVERLSKQYPNDEIKPLGCLQGILKKYA